MATNNIDLPTEALAELLRIARREDEGDVGDLTSLLLGGGDSGAGAWNLVARQEGRFCGPALLSRVLETLAPDVRVEGAAPDVPARDVRRGERIARLTAPSAQMLTAERTMLNVLSHLSGVATLTAQYVNAVRGTAARIFDTRKTLPGWRALQKYAVRCGGGHNHRMGLYDAVLIKDNHLAGVPAKRLAAVVFEMLNGVGRLPAVPRFIEVECDDLEQLGELLKVVGIDVILLDNFGLPDLREAVARRDAAGLRGRVELEASGGVNLDGVRAIAQTGVDRIAVGALTHSAPILDLGLDAA